MPDVAWKSLDVSIAAWESDIDDAAHAAAGRPPHLCALVAPTTTWARDALTTCPRAGPLRGVPAVLAERADSVGAGVDLGPVGDIRGHEVHTLCQQAVELAGDAPWADALTLARARMGVPAELQLRFDAAVERGVPASAVDFLRWVVQHDDPGTALGRAGLPVRNALADDLGSAFDTWAAAWAEDGSDS